MSNEIKEKYLLNFIYLFYLMFMLTFQILSNENEVVKKNNSIYISKQCELALSFYMDRPDLETEYRRRLEFCKNTAKIQNSTSYYENPILSDFASMYGVNGRTRIQIHQGIDIIGDANENIIAIANGIVLETAIANCVGPTLVIDHGKSFDNKKLITLYSHVGEFLVKEGDLVKRGDAVAKLPEKVEFPCMARVRHLHLQIGQKYCEKEEKNTWGCQFFIKDLYSSLNPHNYWAKGADEITCFDKNAEYPEGTITYPMLCKKIKLDK